MGNILHSSMVVCPSWIENMIRCRRSIDREVMMSKSCNKCDRSRWSLLQLERSSEIDRLVSSITNPPSLPLVLNIFKPSTEYQCCMWHVCLIHAQGREKLRSWISSEERVSLADELPVILIPDSHIPVELCCCPKSIRWFANYVSLYRAHTLSRIPNYLPTIFGDGPFWRYLAHSDTVCCLSC